MISQNFGARNVQRIRAFFLTAGFFIAAFSISFILILMTGSEALIGLFIDVERDSETMQLAIEFVSYIWPLFIFAGFNKFSSLGATALFGSGRSAVCTHLDPSAFDECVCVP